FFERRMNRELVADLLRELHVFIVVVRRGELLEQTLHGVVIVSQHPQRVGGAARCASRFRRIVSAHETSVGKKAFARGLQTPYLRSEAPRYPKASSGRLAAHERSCAISRVLVVFARRAGRYFADTGSVDRRSWRVQRACALGRSGEPRHSAI